MNEAAARYGNALFMIARDEDKVLPMQEEIRELKGIFTENPSFVKLLGSSFLSPEERKETLTKCLPGVDGDILSLLKILIDHERTDLIPDVLTSFISITNAHLGVTEGIVYSAARLTKEQLTAVNERVTALEKKKTDLRNVIDPALIGGIRVVIDGHIYDASLRNRLENMKKTLLKKEADR